MTTAPPPDAPPRLQLAGMALQNGVMVLGPTSWAVAVRERDGTISTHAALRPNDGEDRSVRLPMLRGPVRLLNMLRVLPRIRRAVPSARLGMESRGVLGGMVVGTVVTTMLRRRMPSSALADLAAGGVSLAITLASMRSGSIAAYHGAEHKAIGAYEQGIDAAEATREHARCGTQLAVPMLCFTTLATQGALALAPNNRRAARMAGQFVGIAAATELFRAGNRGGGTIIADLAAKAGRALQTHATTAEPTREQLDVAEAALEALVAAERRSA